QVAPTPLSVCAAGQPDVVIGTGNRCTSAYIDEYITLNRIKITQGGELCVRDADLKGRTVRLYVRDITVDNGGALQIGSKDAPIGRSNPANHAAIHFTGREDDGPTKDAAAHVMQADEPCPDPAQKDPAFQKGLQICPGGVLRLFGNTGAP